MADYDVLCSGSSDSFCQDDGLRQQAKEQPVVAEEDGSGTSPDATIWGRMQTYSFEQWASSLCAAVLRSRTSFAMFLRSTLQAQRLLPCRSTKALFPLPIPAPGIFQKKANGSRHRRRLAFNQAFHVCIMALNFWHADFKFVPIESLALEPSSQQQEILARLRNQLRAFGSSGDAFSVPQSGRRITTLVSLLADLSEFVTWEGIGGDAYSRTFPGAVAGFGHLAKVERDLERAEELRPYRSLDPSRLTLSGTASWDPEPYLSDLLWMAFNEPESLRWAAQERSCNVPDLSKESYDLTKDLALLWDINGLLFLKEPPEEHEEDLSMRFFNCFKNDDTDRMIGDRRSRNYVEGRLACVSGGLPTAQSLLDLEIHLPAQRISICASDRKDFYHQIKVPDRRARSNGIWPLLRLSDLEGTKAFKLWSLAASGRKKYAREVEGDFLGSGRKRRTVLKDQLRLQACFGSVPQGDHLGVEFATEAHRNFLQDRGLLQPSEELRSGSPFEGDDVASGLVIDDFYAVSFEDAALSRCDPEELEEGSKRPKAVDRLEKATLAYSEAGMMGSPHKDLYDVEKGKIMGAEIDGSSYVRSLGMTTVACPAQRRLALAYVSLTLAAQACTTDALHACLVGGWTSALLYRRPFMSILQKVYSVPMSEVDQNEPKIIPLPRSMAEEFVSLAVLCPFISTDISAEVQGACYATDSSDAKGAVVACSIPRSLSRALLRTSRRKSSYTRMLKRHEAVLKKIDWLFEEFEEHENDIVFEGPEVERPRAFRFHFIEICGGAGKVSKEVAAYGWIVGPVIDLDRSPAYNFALLRVLEWILFMLEEGRLDSFMVEPPCTTFSPAQYPPSRSYACPRGFNPKDPKTLTGTTLALRALTLMKVAATYRTPGLLEQPRRSKMKRLSEWQYLVNQGLCEEVWCASCMYGSPHLKEFVFLIAAMDASSLHRRCDGSHRHIKIEGKWTKPSATYTDELAFALARVFHYALQSKLINLSQEEPEVDGLENVMVNDIMLSKEWHTQKVWRWKKPSHINIQEILAAERLMRQEAVRHPSTRFPVFMDSNVGLSALVKGRSPSKGLRSSLRRCGSTIVAGNLYPGYHFGPTRWLPADHPTRDHDFPEVCRSLIPQEAEFKDYIPLLKLSGMKRLASNWCRLVLLLYGHLPAWWTDTDSWRYAHVNFKHYPVKRRGTLSKQIVDFDATLGYPGEGPFESSADASFPKLPPFVKTCWSSRDLLGSRLGLGLFQCLDLDFCARSTSCSVSRLALRRGHRFPVGAEAFWILLTLLGSGFGFGLFQCLDLDFSAHSAFCLALVGGFWSALLWFQRLSRLTAQQRPRLSAGRLSSLRKASPPHSCSSSGLTPKRFLGILVLMCCPSLASVHVVRHGPTLVPRDGADKARAEGRGELELPQGRPVLPATQKHRDKLLAVFSEWLDGHGISLDELLMCASPDVEALNVLLEKYGRELFRSGRPYGHYSETLNAVSARRPRIRRSLQPAWDLAYSWLKQEPPSHHLALPFQALLALLVTAWMWGWSRVAGVLALSWGGLTRIGEVLQATRQSLILPEDVGWTVQFALLQISEPKTRFRSARHQVARLDQPQLLKVVQYAFSRLGPMQKLWPASPQTMRSRFQRLLESLSLDKLPGDIGRKIDLGSLRAGGASWLLLVSEDSELTRRRGRWITTKVMEIYIQEAWAIQFLSRLPSSVREQLLSGAVLFQWALDLVGSWWQAAIPESAWPILFQAAAKTFELEQLGMKQMGDGGAVCKDDSTCVQPPLSLEKRSCSTNFDCR